MGYRLPPGQTMQDVLDASAELMREAGIDPTWRGFEDAPKQTGDKQR